MSRWRARLRSYAPYARQGFRLYIYEDLAPTLSVVAETEWGCPYQAELVPSSIREVLEPYEKRDWRLHFHFEGGDPRGRVLSAIERHQGSISKPTARSLGVTVGELPSQVAEALKRLL